MASLYKCSKCSVLKPREDYSDAVKGDNGRRTYCRACASAYDRAYRKSKRGAAVRRAYRKTPIARFHKKAHKHRRRERSKAAGPLTGAAIRTVVERNRSAYGELTCVYCKVCVEHEQWHLEHKHPLALGGTNDVANLAISCGPCNLRKGATSYGDFDREHEEHLRIEHLAWVISRAEERDHIAE